MNGICLFQSVANNQHRQAVAAENRAMAHAAGHAGACHAYCGCVHHSHAPNTVVIEASNILVAKLHNPPPKSSHIEK